MRDANSKPMRSGGSKIWSFRILFAPRVLAVLLNLAMLATAHSTPQSIPFNTAADAYRSGDYSTAAQQWSKLAERQPAAGTFVNLGLAEWQLGRRGTAILAWERSQWVNPFNAAARENLRFARKAAQLEAPELAWYEAASLWLPVNAWALVAGCSLWFAVAMILLPRLFRWKRASWHQALAAAGFAIFLLCLPSIYGINTRAKIAIVMEKDIPLRLTPTQAAQTIMILAEGQPVRFERARGDYLLVRTSYGRGWVERAKLGLICPE